MTKCKWYQTPIQFEAKGTCENPVSRRDKVLRDVKPDLVCDSCDINPIIGFSLITAIVAVPLLVGFNYIFKQD
jgi:hypothetical protein